MYRLPRQKFFIKLWAAWCMSMRCIYSFFFVSRSHDTAYTHPIHAQVCKADFKHPVWACMMIACQNFWLAYRRWECMQLWFLLLSCWGPPVVFCTVSFEMHLKSSMQTWRTSGPLTWTWHLTTWMKMPGVPLVSPYPTRHSRKAKQKCSCLQDNERVYFWSTKMLNKLSCISCHCTLPRWVSYVLICVR